MKRTAFSILLLLSLLAPIATTFYVLQHQKKQVKREVKRKIIAGIDKKELVLLKFSNAEKSSKLKWKHSKEFKFNNEMYDVVESLQVGDTTYFWCWWDYEETALNKQLIQLVSVAWNNNPKNQENQKRLFQFFKSLYFLQSADRTALESEVSRSMANNFVDLYQSVPNSPPIPPPKIV